MDISINDLEIGKTYYIINVNTRNEDDIPVYEIKLEKLHKPQDKKTIQWFSEVESNNETIKTRSKNLNINTIKHVEDDNIIAIFSYDTGVIVYLNFPSGTKPFNKPVVLHEPYLSRTLTPKGYSDKGQFGEDDEYILSDNFEDAIDTLEKYLKSIRSPEYILNHQINYLKNLLNDT
ncbi:MAG: hypothetical protein NC548_51220 [Lachnospiraceae bacterium]|nr:hypothetical protein [Lachnospiraceae bacterium]